MLPSTLEALKNQARSVQGEAAAIEAQKQAAWRQQLIDTAREQLGDLWQYTGGEPAHYEPWKASFRLSIPGHRGIYARFGVYASGRAFWKREPYYGARWDGEGDPLWMVEGDAGPTYYQTLGAALVAAEQN